MECKVDDVIDLSANISWTPIKIDSEKESHEEEEDVKVVADPPRTLTFSEKMKRLSFHRLPLKERMKDRTISYVNLLCSNPPPPRSDKEPMRQGCRRLAQQKDK